MAHEMMTRSEFSEYMQAFEERMAMRLDERLNERVGALEQRMNVQFEDTRSLLRLSLEGLGALRESTARGFSVVRRENHENRTLLEEAVKHVRRVERVEDSRRAKRSR
jgi:hypothetical protein